MISIYIVLLFVLLINANKNDDVFSTIRIYSNLAEIIQPLGKLPLEFTDDDWNQIRSDSITLLGENLTITLQTITEKKKSLNGTEIYIRSPISSDKTTIKLIKGILIDEINYLVKIQDQSIADEKPLYFNVPSDQIYYLEQPTKPTHYVNFTYHSTDSNVFISYLQSNLNWQTQYQLHLYGDKNTLIAMANIRNDGKSSISIHQAELIGGDINLQKQEQNVAWYNFKARSSPTFNAQPQVSAMQMISDDTIEATIEQGKELAGLYIFPINKPFTINAKTNYLLPMFRPHITVERYGFISKIFSPISTTGKAQRSYRLKSDRYLSQGNCIIRENDRIVGETILPNLAAKYKHQFSIGEDADIIYKENITLISLKNYNETEFNGKISNNNNNKDQSSIVIVTHTQFIYKINVELKNYKDYPVKIEYEQKGLQNYQNVSITKTHDHYFIQDSSTIKSSLTLKANTTENFSYTLILVR